MNEYLETHEENNLPRPSGGPVFTPGPGWGQHVGRWLGKYFWPVVVPVIALLGLYLGARF